MKRSIAMVEDLIKLEEARDKEFKLMALAANKGSKAVGDSMMLQHLKNLKELIELESRQRVGKTPFV